MNRKVLVKFIVILSLLTLATSALIAMRDAPDWSVDPAQYEYNGSITAAVFIDETQVGSSGDMVGAFVDEECRGVADAFEFSDNYIFFLTVYSNATSGDNLTFKYWDSVGDVIYDIEEELEFTPDMVHGDPLNPFEMNIVITEEDAIEGTVTLSGGSGDVEDVDVTADGETVNPNATGYYIISITSGTYDVTASLEGYIDSTIVGVEVIEGQTTSDVDFILYSEVTVGSIEGIVSLGTREAPDWSVDPAQYEYNGSITAAVFIDETQVGSSGDMVGAFVDEECRGVADAFEFSDNYIFFLTVYSNATSGENLTFKYWDSVADVIYDIDETIEFTPDMVLGTPLDPYQLTASAGEILVEVLEGTTVVAQTLTTDGALYIIDNIPAGIYDVRASAEDYVPETLTGIEIVAGEITLNVDFTLYPEVTVGWIQGTVTLEGGDGNIQQVEVSINGNTTYPDEYGNYEITILPGTYNVTASLEGYIDSTITGVEVFEGQSTTGIDFILYSSEEPDIFIDPDSLAFGNVTIGDVSSIKSFYIFNQGNVDLDIFEISTPEAFEIKKGDAGDWVTNISNFIILDNSFQKIYVRFIPTVTGSYSGDISISSNDPDEDTVYVNVSGTGVEYAVPNIEVDPTEVPFGNVTILSTKEELFTISNTGSAELIIDSIYVPVNSGFMIRSGDSGEYSNFIQEFSISVGNEKDIYVEFIPPAIGQYSTYITIKSNVGSDFVNVSGIGVEYDVPDIDVNPVELHFGGVSIYQSVEDTIKIMNTGNAILEINNIFSLSGYEIKLDDESWGNHIPAFDIPPSEEEIIYVKFHPEALITYNGVIYITSNDLDESSIPVLVEGQGIPVLSEKIPDAFTPNGDGLNDEFIIGPFQESGGDKAQFIVYDIRGKILHETNRAANIPLTWDGNDNSGNKCISGAYIYVYLINDNVFKRGKIYLIR